MPALRAGSVAAVSANGVLGDPAGASAGEGAETTAVMVGALRAAIARWEVDDRGRLVPEYPRGV